MYSVYEISLQNNNFNFNSPRGALAHVWMVAQQGSHWDTAEVSATRSTIISILHTLEFIATMSIISICRWVTVYQISKAVLTSQLTKTRKDKKPGLHANNWILLLGHDVQADSLVCMPSTCYLHWTPPVNMYTSQTFSLPAIPQRILHAKNNLDKHQPQNLSKIHSSTSWATKP